MRSVVVLPAPFGPTRPKISPGVDGQIDARHGERAVVALHEAFGADDLRHGLMSPLIDRSRLNPTESLASLMNRTSTVPVVAST